MRNIDLTGKTAIVTGGGQGIGLATATSLFEAGANVILNYFPDNEGGNATIAQTACDALGDRCIALPADVRDPDQLTSMCSEITARFGGIDILVNNAGILRDRSFKKMTHSEWADVIDTNLTGVFNCCKSVVDSLNEGASIINVASLSAVTGFFGQANYASAKAGVITFTKVLSKELARQKIRVNAVAPGVVDTEMGKSIPEENRQAMIKMVPLSVFGWWCWR